jgi:superfamily II DNA or RNA helicase
MKRKHQIDFERVTDLICRRKSLVKKILAMVTPGGGKSTLPIISSRLKDAGLVDKLLWICPRMSLQAQGERSFIDPFFRSMFTHNAKIRSSTNEVDPSRGLDGFITTYQAIAADKFQTVLQEVQRHRYAIVLDEFHHVNVGGDWYKAPSRRSRNGSRFTVSGSRLTVIIYR